MTIILDLARGKKGDGDSVEYQADNGAIITLHGTGLKYDSQGYLKDGTIKSITASDSFFGLQQTIKLNVDASDFYKHIVQPIIALDAQIDGWADTKQIVSTTATKIVVRLEDNSQVEITGKGLGTYPTTGEVSKIEHFSKNGDRLDTLSNLDIPLGVTLGALGQSDTLFNYMTKGSNTVVQESAFGPTLDGGLGNDTLDGGEGAFPMAEYRFTALSGIVGDLGQGKVTGGGGNDTLIDISGISGSRFDDQLTGRNVADRFDTLRGNEGDDSLTGRAGTDFLDGGEGKDELVGGDGDDNLIGGRGGDRLDGGDGDDTLSFSGGDFGNAGITVDLAITGLSDFGYWGKDRVENVENVVGSGGDDTVIGTNKANVLSGNGGADHVEGGGGDDTLYGETNGSVVQSGVAGNDVVDGGAGRDNLFTGEGVDLLIGGADRDTFSFSRAPTTFIDDFDKIKDFDAGEDLFTLSQFGFDLEPGKLSADAFVEGTEAKDQEDRLLYDKASGKVYFDHDGSNNFDDPLLIAILLNREKLSAADFEIV